MPKQLSNETTKEVATQSPVLPARDVPDRTRLFLFVRAGGRCEFDGCNKNLLEHHLTLTAGNFAEMAHVVAFSERGPRGDDPQRPDDINDISNLMLLCPQCHKLIDDNPENFSRETLDAYKKDHEARIEQLTALGPDRKTAVLIFKALIGGQAIAMPLDQIFEATAPRWPASKLPMTIDLTGITGGGSAFYETACETIQRGIDRLLGPEGEGVRNGHVSVFALAPMPLLMCLGRQLSNKVPTDVFQRHREDERWTWRQDGPPINYMVQRVRDGRPDKVTLILSLSGSIPVASLPADSADATIYEIALDGMVPAPTFLRRRQDLEAFRPVYQEALAVILKEHGLLASIDLFPAVPAPIAVLCGRELLPKVHPKLRVFDYDRAQGGFVFTLEV